MTTASAAVDPSELLRHLEEFPLLPAVVAELVRLPPSDPDYFDHVFDVVCGAPDYAARLLAAANSAASAPRTPVTTLRAALARLGSHGTANIVLAASVTRVFVPTQPWQKRLWRHAIQTAHCAQLITAGATDPPVDPDEAFTAALLHDLGHFVMLAHNPARLATLDETRWDTPAALIEAERSICGYTHAELGAMACRKWGLPTVIEQAVATHHGPTAADPDAKLEPLAAIIRYADHIMFPSALPTASPTPARDDEHLIALLARHQPDELDITAENLTAAIRNASAYANTVIEVIGLT